MPLLILALFLSRSSLHAFVNGQNALSVLGQTSFTSNGTGTDDSHLNNPVHALYVEDLGHTWLFVPELFNNRVLVYEDNFGTGAHAQYVIGQPDFTSNTVGAGPASLSHPQDVAYDTVHHDLFVVDYLNNRVLEFNMTSIHNGMSADHVLGQPDFSTYNMSGGRCQNFLSPASASGMAWPTGVTYDSVHTRLFVADSCNNRVLVFNLALPLTDGMPAVQVLGQTDMAGTGFGTTDNTFHNPEGLTYDSTHQWLFVADYTSNRVLMFDLSGSNLSTGMSAQNVLGQTNFTNQLAATTQNGFSKPSYTDYDAVQQRLFVADWLNKRVMIFNLQGGITNGMNASTVLGQPDFNSSNLFTTQSGGGFTDGVSYDSNGRRLFISELQSNRILIYSDVNLAGTPDVSCSGNTDYTICGSVKTMEDSSLLPGVPIELRDSQGKLLSTQKSNSAGAYRFTGLTSGDTYYVTPVLGRTQSAAPFHVAAANLQPVGDTANFQIRGWPGILKISGPAGSPVLISSANYTGADTPMVNPSTAASVGFYSAAIGWDGTASVQVPIGSYYLTCWKAQPSGATLTHTRAPTSGSQGPASVAANQVVNIACP